MSPRRVLALLLDPSWLFTWQGLAADSWQRDLLFSGEPFVLLNCSRQAGKSTVVAALALLELLTRPGALVLLVGPSERQSHELLRKVVAAYRALGKPLAAVKFNQSELELANGARLVALPGREDTIRSFSAVRLLLIDEAARVPDDLYRAVRPMLAVSHGRLIALSTPFGQRGWFHAEWTGGGPWQRIHIPWKDCPRIRPDFIAEETRALGQHWVDQEYNGLFTALEGLVYPEFAQCIVTELPSDWRFLMEDFRSCPDAGAPGERGHWIENLPSSIANLRKVGGIDFGWRNPFAAVWGVIDASDVMWIVGERYGTETPLADHAAHLPRKVTWYADPAGAGDISALRRLNLAVKKGDNAIARGIAQVTARIRTGRLKVLDSCVHLLEEARLYRYPTAQERHLLGENPIDAHNHALGALRYLIASIDKRPPRPPEPSPPPPRGTPIEDDERFWR